jgi:hypothetical protein
MGQGQLEPSTARALGVEDPFDTLENIEASGRYLAQQLARFGEIRLALAAYNAGPGAVAAIRSVPRNGETELYVERVLRIHRAAIAAAARDRARTVAVVPRVQAVAAEPVPDNGGASARRIAGQSGMNPSSRPKAIGKKFDRRPSRKRRTPGHAPRRDDTTPVRSAPPDRLTLPRLAERTPS